MLYGKARGKSPEGGCGVGEGGAGDPIGGAWAPLGGWAARAPAWQRARGELIGFEGAADLYNKAATDAAGLRGTLDGGAPYPVALDEGGNLGPDPAVVARTPHVDSPSLVLR